MSEQSLAETATRAGPPGWPADDGEMAARIRAHDWAATPLGAIAAWPVSLRQAVDGCLGCGFASLVCWGPELVQVCNDAAWRILRGAGAQALGVPARQAWAGHWDRLAPLVEQVLRTGKPALGEDVPLEPRRGGARGAGRETARGTAYFTCSLGPLRDEAGAVAGVCATVLETTAKVRALAQRHGRLPAVTVDLAARQQAREALRESEARARAMANLVPDLLWSGDALGRFEWVNRRWLEYTGLGEQDVLVEGWRQALHPEDLPRVLAGRNKAMQNEHAWESEHRIRRFDGDFRWHLVRAQPLRSRAGRVVQWFGSATDVHEQRLSRQLLEQRVTERTQALRQLLLRVESVQDDERRRIARELHDSLGQYLASLLLAVSGLRRELADAQARQRLEALEARMQRVDRELDRLVFILRPTALEDCGLGEGVEAYVRTWSELTGVTVDLELPGLDNVRLPAQVQAAAFRVVQEALTNVAKYAQASQVSVSLARRRRHLVATIEDDGVGFDVAEATTPAPSRVNWGLLGMQERIEALGGSFTIESQPGAGTTVLWRVPLAPADEAMEAGKPAAPGAQPQATRAADVGREWSQATRPLAQILLGRLAEAEEGVRARDDFLAVVGHQLRSPMNALSLQLHAVERMAAQPNVDGARVAAELGRSRGILRRFVQRATVLLDVSRLNAGQFRLEVEPVDVPALVGRVVGACSQDAAFRGAQVHATVEPGLTAHWDARAVEELLCNLVGNAIKYGEGAPIAVTVAREDGGHVRLSVSDQGPGLAPAQVLRLYESFERVAGASSDTSGFGIGLWLVGQIARAHGGKVDVEVGPQGGTTIAVRLPVLAACFPPTLAATS